MGRSPLADLRPGEHAGRVARRACARYCGGGTTGAPSTAAACHTQRGSQRKAARHRDEVRVTGRNDFLRLRRRGDQPDGHRACAGRVADCARQRHLIPRPEWNLLRRAKRRRSTRRSNRSHARRAGARIRSTRRAKAPVDPVGARQAHAERPSHGPCATNGVEHFERERNAPVERSAVRIRACIGDRRQEFVQQVAVRHVQLECVDACAVGAPRAGNERIAYRRKTPRIERGRRRPHAARAPAPMAQRASSRRRRAG